LYSRLRFLTSACLIAFGTVVAAGAVGVLPALIERLSVGTVEVASSCKGEVRLPWGRACSSPGDTASVAVRIPGADITVAESPDPVHVTTVEPIEPVQNTASTATQLIEPREAEAPAPQLARAPPAVEESPQEPRQAAPVAQAPRIAPAVKAKPRPAKKVARREPKSERERDEALSTVRRVGRNKVREIPLDAFAYDGAPRRLIIIRPTSIQDVYYYYRR
jgi:hypothetical protein